MELGPWSLKALQWAVMEAQLQSGTWVPEAGASVPPDVILSLTPELPLGLERHQAHR